MKTSIRENVHIESFYQEFSEPEGYGCFDEDQLMERTEDITEEEETEI